jgi:hypothetical protein
MFNAAPGYEIEEFIDGKLLNKKDTRIPFQGYLITYSKNKEDYQIVKAFEHLRKLCGAPEPLSFE